MDFSAQIAGLLNFSLYFAVSIVFVLVFKYVYALATPYDEWKLIKEQKSSAASLAFGGAIIGFAIALGSVVSNSVSLLDYGMWAIVALIAQLMAFALIRFIFMPKVSSRIENGEVSAGIIVAATSIAVGVLNAACVTY